MRPYPSNTNSFSPYTRKSTEFLLPNESNIINIDTDEPNETPHQLHQPEINVRSSNFTNTLVQSQLSVQPIKENETSTQNFRETFVQIPEAEEDDYSLSYIVAIGRKYCSKIKDSSRNITGNKDHANSRVPLRYLNRSGTSQAIREQHHALNGKRPYAGALSSLRKDKSVMSSIPSDHVLYSNVDPDYMKWQEWQAKSKRARNVQDNKDFQHSSSFEGQDYPNLQTYSAAISKDYVSTRNF